MIYLGVVFFVFLVLGFIEFLESEGFNLKFLHNRVKTQGRRNSQGQKLGEGYP